MNRKLLIAALIIGGGLGVWKVLQQRTAENYFPVATTEQFIAFMCDHAVADAEIYDHVKLDYSIDSLKEVDRILGRVHDAYAKDPRSVSVRGLSAEYGAYVGEVIRRNQANVYWTRDSEVMGEKSFPLHWKDGESYPFTWCTERIESGEADSIWFKYSVVNDPAWKQSLSSAAARSKKR